MVIQLNEKVHIITRRLFEGDLRRHFAGVVEDVAGPNIRVKGFAFVYDEATYEFVRRKDVRIRIFPISDAGVIINLLPSSAKLANITYKIDEIGHRIVTDGESFAMNINEFSAKH